MQAAEQPAGMQADLSAGMQIVTQPQAVTQAGLYTATQSTTQSLATAALSIYPNPATQQLRISGGEGLEVSWHNLLGQAVRRDELGSGDSLLDVSAMPRGVYWLRVTQRGEEVDYQRVVLAQ